MKVQTFDLNVKVKTDERRFLPINDSQPKCEDCEDKLLKCEKCEVRMLMQVPHILLGTQSWVRTKSQSLDQTQIKQYHNPLSELDGTSFSQDWGH